MSWVAVFYKYGTKLLYTTSFISFPDTLCATHQPSRESPACEMVFSIFTKRTIKGVCFQNQALDPLSLKHAIGDEGAEYNNPHKRPETLQLY